MPTGRVKFYDDVKGFGFIAADDGQDVHVRSSALASGAVLKKGARVEFGVASGARGLQALSVRVIDAPPSLQHATRPPAEDMAARVEDLIKMLDREGGNLRRGRYPDAEHGRRIAMVLRRFADDFDS